MPGDERFINPIFRKQIENWEQSEKIQNAKATAQNTKTALTAAAEGRYVKALTSSLKIGSEIRESISEGDTTYYPYLLIVAIAVDFADFVPIAGTIINLVCWPILFYGTFGQGRLSYKVQLRIVFFILTFSEFIPVVSVLPLNSLAILLMWKKTAEMRKKDEDKLSSVSQTQKELKGKISQLENQKKLSYASYSE